MDKKKLIQDARAKLCQINKAKEELKNQEKELSSLFSSWLSDFDNLPPQEKEALITLAETQFTIDESPITPVKMPFSLSLAKKVFMYDRPLRECIGYQPLKEPSGKVVYLDYTFENNEVSVTFQTLYIWAGVWSLDKQLRPTDKDFVNKAATEISSCHVDEVTKAILEKAQTKVTEPTPANLGEKLEEWSNTVYVKVLRGPATFVWYSPDLGDNFLQLTKGNAPEKKPSGLSYTGKFKWLNCYENNKLPEKTIVVGYKGKDDREAGCFLCQYGVIWPSPALIDPQTAETYNMYMNRFGVAIDDACGKNFAILTLE